MFQIDAPGQSIIGVPLVPRDQRKLGIDRDPAQLAAEAQLSCRRRRFAVFQQPSLPGAFGLPVQFAIKTTEPALRLNEVSRAFLDTVAQERHVHVHRHRLEDTTRRSR